jgi:predicted transcriptional regulator
MPMLMRRGFVPEEILPDHYLEGRDEVVLTWRQGRVLPQVAVFSFRPDVPPLIWDGRKQHEYRRNRAVSLAPGSLVLVYESAPVKAVTGCFVSGQVTVGDPSSLVRLERGESRRVAASFLEGATRASAIEVFDPVRFESPLALEPLTGLVRPPMSYAFLR